MVPFRAVVAFSLFVWRIVVVTSEVVMPLPGRHIPGANFAKYVFGLAFGALLGCLARSASFLNNVRGSWCQPPHATKIRTW